MAASRFRHQQLAADSPAKGDGIGAKQEAQHVVHRALTQPHDAYQQLLGNR
jgi:hypothetical protein